MNNLKISLAIALLCSSVGAFAQTSSSSSQGTANSSNDGNQQSITFTSPGETTSNVNSTYNGTQTVNTVKSGADKSTVEYTGDYTVKNVPSVNGPNLTTSNDTCMGSTSGSINGAGFGVGLGSTWVDGNCKMLKNSRELWNMGMKAAAIALLCADEANRQALEMTGTVCPQSMTAEQRKAAFGKQASAEGARVEAPVASAQAVPANVPASFAKANLADPIIAGRAGLPVAAR